MQKFSLFDFLAFIVPGSTMLIVVYAWFSLNFPNTYFVAEVDPSLWIIPMLFFSFILGHIMSWIGTTIDRRCETKRLAYLRVITKYLENKNYKQYILDVFNENESKSFELLSDCITPENYTCNLHCRHSVDELKLANKFAQVIYNRAEALLEIQEKNKLPLILQSQYAFFRNSMVTCIMLALFFSVVIIITLFHIGLLKWNFCIPVALLLSIGFSYLCFLRMLKRKLLMVDYTFQNFIAFMTLKKKLND